MGQKQGGAEDLNTVVQSNIRRLLGKLSPEDYCKEKGRVLYYVSGAKRGKPVSTRALRYAISEEQSPRLDMIAAVAAKERIPPHALLISPEAPPMRRRWDDTGPEGPSPQN